MIRYDVLPPEQRALLPHLVPVRELGFVLYGGTAIALQLGHRRSVDFDFFSDRPLEEAAIRGALPLLERARTIEQGPRSWTVVTQPDEAEGGVKLSFFGGLRFGRVGEPIPSEGGELLLASLDDLLGHKLKVLLQRVEAKDYLDIAAMLRNGLSLERGLGAAEALFSTFSAMEALRALAYFEGGDLARVGQDDRQTLTAAISRTGAAMMTPVVSRELSG